MVIEVGVLLLLGSLVTGAYNEELVAQLHGLAAPIRRVMTTVPANARPAPAPFATFEERAGQAG